MKTYTIISSETVTYRTEVKAETHEQALDFFCNTRITDQSKLIPEHYEGFQIDSVEENG